MAGLTHVALRSLIAGFGGCGLYTSEMLSCRAVVHETPERSVYLRRTPAERPFFWQLVGNEPEAMAKAVRHLERISPPDGFDINMGCGEPRIRNSGAGCGLMRDAGNARRVTAACRAATALPLTAKLRLGWEESADDMMVFAKMLQDEGIDAVTLHPRLAKERFTRRARWRYIAMLKRELAVPVIGNGDILSAPEVAARFEETGCDGIMIGRLAAASPWIFAEIAGLIDPAAISLNSVYAEFARLLEEHFPPERRLGRLKEFTIYFARNFQFGHNLATRVQNASTMNEAKSVAGEFFEMHGSRCHTDSGTDPTGAKA